MRRAQTRRPLPSDPLGSLCGNGLLLTTALYPTLSGGCRCPAVPGCRVRGGGLRHRGWSGADAEAGEVLQRHTGLVQDLLDGLLVVLREGLVQQDVLLEEPVDATLDDLREGLLRLALLARGLLGD